jgi:hypothetical protein
MFVPACGPNISICYRRRELDRRIAVTISRLALSDGEVTVMHMAHVTGNRPFPADEPALASADGWIGQSFHYWRGA